MSFELWLAYALAAAIILVIPGPTILLVISQAVAHGRRSVIPLAAGVLFGDFTAMTLSLLGLGAILSASAALFSIFKWVGALYLVYLGIKMWRKHPSGGEALLGAGSKSARRLFKSAYIVTSLNPKGIAFFVAFLPQFVDPAQPAAPQLMILGGTFLALAAINAFLYATFAGQLRDRMHNHHVQRWFNRMGGGALVGAGLITAGLQRST